jgi:hypothetical protein
MLWNAPVCRFDRQRDQFLLGEKSMGRLGNISQIGLIPEQGEDGKPRYVMSVIFSDAAPCQLYRQKQPDELRQLASKIANFIGVTFAEVSAHEQLRNLMSLADAPWWLQITAVVTVTSAIWGPMLFVARHASMATLEKLLSLGMMPVLVSILLALLYFRGKKIIVNEPDAELRSRLSQRLRGEFRLFLAIAIPVSLVSAAIAAWLIICYLPGSF